jgi:hypothetical protein
MAYTTNDCSDDGFEVGFSTVCTAVGYTPSDDDYVLPIVNPPPSVSTTSFPTMQTTAVPYYLVNFCAGNNPTSAPVASPTAFPTASKPAPASFEAKQVLHTTNLSSLF